MFFLNPKRTSVHPKIALRPDGLNKAVWPGTHAKTTWSGAGWLQPELNGRGQRSRVECYALHAGVESRSILLVLQPSLGQVDGKHAGDSNQAGDPPIDQFGRQTDLLVSHLCEDPTASVRASAVVAVSGGDGGLNVLCQLPSVHLLCLSRTYLQTHTHTHEHGAVAGHIFSWSNIILSTRIISSGWRLWDYYCRFYCFSLNVLHNETKVTR